MFLMRKLKNSAPKQHIRRHRSKTAAPGLKTQYRVLKLPSKLRVHSSLVRWVLITLCLLTSFYLIYTSTMSSFSISGRQSEGLTNSDIRVLQPVNSNSNSKKSRTKRKKKHDPEKWLRLNSNLNHHETGNEWFNDRPKAALISLVRNEELEGILQSMRQLEMHWNKRYNYPWMFFSEKDFSEEFKSATTNATSAPTSYHLIPKAHWSLPKHIDLDRYHSSLSYLGTLGVGKGYLLSYRNMCRWNSGFFYLHPALLPYDYYWRVEPDVHFFCDISYDPFRFLRDNDIVYGFNMNILDDARSFASLWKVTREFIRLNPDLVHPDADIDWLVDDGNRDDSNGDPHPGEYNNCQFFSNFEIASLNFFRSEANTAYFSHLDSAEISGFFYERYGDAPVHTLSVALFAGGKDRTWYFRDIGYQHDIARHCPGPEVRRGLCDCEETGLDENFYKLVPMESGQRKPGVSCLRLWLGGEWMERRKGWDMRVDEVVGGDGLGGYVRERFE